MINSHLQHLKEWSLRAKISGFFYLETLKNVIFNEKFYPQITTIRAFFLQIRALFPNFRKRAGETSSPSPPPTSYAPEVGCFFTNERTFLFGNCKANEKKKIQPARDSNFYRLVFLFTPTTRPSYKIYQKTD